MWVFSSTPFDSDEPLRNCKCLKVPKCTWYCSKQHAEQIHSKADACIFPQSTTKLQQLVGLMSKIKSTVWQHRLVTLVKTGRSGNSPCHEATVKGCQHNDNNKDSHNSLLTDKAYPKSPHQSFVHLGRIAFSIKRCLGFLPAIIATSYNFTFRPLDKCVFARYR